MHWSYSTLISNRVLPFYSYTTLLPYKTPTNPLVRCIHMTTLLPPYLYPLYPRSQTVPSLYLPPSYTATHTHPPMTTVSLAHHHTPVPPTTATPLPTTTPFNFNLPLHTHLSTLLQPDPLFSLTHSFHHYIPTSLHYYCTILPSLFPYSPSITTFPAVNPDIFYLQRYVLHLDPHKALN